MFRKAKVERLIALDSYIRRDKASLKNSLEEWWVLSYDLGPEEAHEVQTQIKAGEEHDPALWQHSDSSLGEPSANADTLKSWGVPGSNVKQRVTERADAKAAEDKDIFLAVADAVYSLESVHLKPVPYELHKWLDKQAKKYGQFLSWEEAYDHFMGQENETT